MFQYPTTLQDSCFDAQHHLEQVINRYIVNVSTATRLCGDALCQGQGRCIRKHWDDDVFLHLHSCHYQIKQQHRGGPLTVSGGLSQDDINLFDKNFDCMCYTEKPCRSVISSMSFTTQSSTQGTALLIGHTPSSMYIYICVSWCGCL